jgi:probable HAF family extracellular repeat protein
MAGWYYRGGAAMQPSEGAMERDQKGRPSAMGLLPSLIESRQLGLHPVRTLALTLVTTGFLPLLGAHAVQPDMFALIGGEMVAVAGRVLPVWGKWRDAAGYLVDPKTGKTYFAVIRYNGKGQVVSTTSLPAPQLGRAMNTGRAKDPFFVGTNSSDGVGPEQALLWNPDTGNPINLGTLDPGNANAFSNATDVSDDGRSVAGFSDFNNGGTQHAFKWTQSGGIVDLGAGNGAAGFSRGFGISGDGSTIVGDSDFPSGPRSAFLWTQVGGFTKLGTFGGNSLATAITDDASVIVGQAGLGANNSVAFRWTQAAGMVSVGALSGEGDNNAAAVGLSDNGKIVVGISAPRPLTFGNLGYDWGTDTHGFRWTQETGIQDLKMLLAAAGVDMTGITIVAVTGISPDGQFMAWRRRRPHRPTKPFPSPPNIATIISAPRASRSLLLMTLTSTARATSPGATRRAIPRFGS